VCSSDLFSKSSLRTSNYLHSIHRRRASNRAELVAGVNDSNCLWSHWMASRLQRSSFSSKFPQKIPIRDSLSNDDAIGLGGGSSPKTTDFPAIANIVNPKFRF